MTADIENLILEHLRHIRARVDLIADDLGTVKLRVTSLEAQVASLHADNAIVHQRMDRIEARIAHIERRLDLVDTAPD
jgi:chromosome segregation ATPase